MKVESAAELAETITAIAPVGVRALVDRRLARLTEHAFRVICAAATVGRELTVDALAAICELCARSRVRGARRRPRGAPARRGLPPGRPVPLPARGRSQCGLRDHSDRRTPTAPPPHRRGHRSSRSADGRPRRRGAVPISHITTSKPRRSACSTRPPSYAERAADDAAQRFAFGEAARWYEHAIQFRSDDARRVGAGPVAARARTRVGERQADRAGTRRAARGAGVRAAVPRRGAPRRRGAGSRRAVGRRIGPATRRAQPARRSAAGHRSLRSQTPRAGADRDRVRRLLHRPRPSGPARHRSARESRDSSTTRRRWRPRCSRYTSGNRIVPKRARTRLAAGPPGLRARVDRARRECAAAADAPLARHRPAREPGDRGVREQSRRLRAVGARAGQPA